jgi:hypothetical protein
MIVALWLACQGADGPDLKGPTPDDPAEQLVGCEREPFPELQVTCRVEAAAKAAAIGRPEVAEQACDRMDTPLWKDECHFRAGEEFGHAGVVGDALSHCQRAGKYAKFCLTHLGWRQPPDKALDQDPARAVSAWMKERQEADRALAGASARFTADANAVLASRFWFNLYYGTGAADPRAARAAPDDVGPAARQGFALEAVRILAGSGDPSPTIVTDIEALWSSDADFPRGAAVPADQRFGRYHPPIGLQPARGRATLPLYGGGRRWVDADPAADLRTAILWALYFRPETPAEVFVPFLDDPNDTVRWTAAELVRTTPSATLDHEAVLRKLEASADPGLRESGHEGLRGRDWERYVAGAPAYGP